MEDIFRFMVLRPPDAIQLDSSNHIDTTNEKSNYQQGLKTARNSENALEEMVRKSEEFIATEKFVGNLDQLTIPLIQFKIQLLREDSPSQNIINQLIQHVFGHEAGRLISDADYVKDRWNSADSLIALIIVKNEQTQNYKDLIQALRLFGIIERVAVQDDTLDIEGAIEEALNQTVLLPDNIFPLPAPISVRGINTEEQEEIKNEIIKRKNERELLKKQLRSLQNALDELSDVKASDFKQDKIEAEIQEPEQKERLVHAQVKENPWILSEKRINRLSANTIKVIEDLGISLNPTSYPATMERLEKELMEKGAKYYTTEIPKSIEEAAPRLTLGMGEGAFRQIGIADLEIVKQELLKYQAGEVAHIENVLKGETKERTHRILKRSEETYLTETETTEETENDLQSTDRFELQTETQETIKQDSRFGVDVTVKYGGIVDVTANTKYALDNSSEKTTRMATNYAREVINRSVSRIQERVLKKQVQTTIQETEETNFHKVDNVGKEDHVVGIYRWVDKVYKAQVYNYGERLMVEFIVPEPAAFTHFTTQNKTPEGITIPEPKEPTDPDSKESLKPSHIKPENYQKLVQQYQVIDVEPPPPIKKYVPYVFRTNKEVEGYQKESEISNKKYIIEGDKKENLTVPPGYVAQAAWGIIHAPHWDHYKNDGANAANIMIGTQIFPLLWEEWPPFKFTADLSYNPTTVPIAVNTVHKTSVSISIEILCKRADALNEWQQKTYAAIIVAYKKLKSDYEDQLTAAAIEEGIAISGGNPLLNRELEKTELKKGALTLLTRNTSPHFNFVGSVVTTEKDLINIQKNQEYYEGYPEINFNEADREAPYIQFFEQAFEWTQMMYTFYPYYWARKKNWPKLQQIQDNDPLHAQFLQAGSARVLVPVRPGYEDSILYYLETNKIWNGGGPPSVSSKLYVSLIKSIKEQQSIYHTTREGTISVEKDTKVVTGNETKFTKDDVDREIVIKGKNYRIAKIVSSKELVLTEDYREPNEQDVPYSIGAKLVDEPWEVKIPTSLVWLQKSEMLPDWTQS